MKSIALSLIASLALFFGGCSTTAATGESAAATPASVGAAAGPAKEAPYGHRYVCNCGPDCSCGSNANLPGKCTCGKPMVLKKILLQDPAAYLTCGCLDCACDKVSPTNPAQCSCDKTLKRFPKKGAYTCACPDCPCNMQSRNPGLCTCGKEMKAQ